MSKEQQCLVLSQEKQVTGLKPIVSVCMRRWLTLWEGCEMGAMRETDVTDGERRKRRRRAKEDVLECIHGMHGMTR